MSYRITLVAEGTNTDDLHVAYNEAVEILGHFSVHNSKLPTTCTFDSGGATVKLVVEEVREAPYEYTVELPRGTNVVGPSMRQVRAKVLRRADTAEGCPDCAHATVSHGFSAGCLGRTADGRPCTCINVRDSSEWPEPVAADMTPAKTATTPPKHDDDIPF